MPGLIHVYRIEAHNAAGMTQTGQGFDLVIHPPPDVCGDDGQPGAFTVSVGTPFCPSGDPAIPLTWTESEGADNVYHYDVYRERGHFGGGSVNFDALGFTYDVTAGVSAGETHTIQMSAEDAQDETKLAYANPIFVHVPIDVCGAQTSPPETSAWAPVEVDSTSAVLKAGVKPNGTATTASVEWGETAS